MDDATSSIERGHRRGQVVAWTSVLAPLVIGPWTWSVGALVFFGVIEVLAAAIVGGIAVARTRDDPGWGFLLGLVVAPVFGVAGLLTYVVWVLFLWELSEAF